VLYRLERAGFVSVRWETPERGVPRKYYQLTDDGRAEHERLASEWTSFAGAMRKLLVKR
jgi:PadR family transcriptional regulator PadR